ncbi:hypothetical protein TBK1r_60310 [Stieleria magnilauensis]|uniref:Uncharacterized protein n=1 Tax=Stieleria magnilauensis TaxID=2527963 RepID=A0ABX5Y1X4_9BACT|nr:hypothetical protein TBK1r_59530 [Planctomycetes bacterium TBK1r]QDV87004.1 hypothetical protein TBK1r_60310 [Planctomycetes bacterium TBK1r]
MFIDWSRGNVPPGEAYDATGKKLPELITSIDTESGECEKCVRHDGRLLVAECGTEILRLRVRFPPPITVYLYT